MVISIREGQIADTQECAQICFDAFRAVAEEHNFQPDFPSVEAAVRVVSVMLEHAGFYCAIAERDGEIIGSNFLDERAEIVGLGPITVRRQVRMRVWAAYCWQMPWNARIGVKRLVFV